VGRGVFFKLVSPSPPWGVGAPELLNLGVLFYCCLVLTMRSIRTEAEPQNLGVLMYFNMSTPFNVEWSRSAGNTMGWAYFLRSATLSSTRGWGPNAPQFGGSPLCLHPLTQNDHLQQGNTRGGGACFLRSATTYIPRGGAPALPSLELPFIYVYTLRRRTTELGL